MIFLNKKIKYIFFQNNGRMHFSRIRLTATEFVAQFLFDFEV